jgi:primosomal protein N'
MMTCATLDATVRCWNCRREWTLHTDLDSAVSTNAAGALTYLRCRCGATGPIILRMRFCSAPVIKARHAGTERDYGTVTP